MRVSVTYVSVCKEARRFCFERIPGQVVLLMMMITSSRQWLIRIRAYEDRGRREAHGYLRDLGQWGLRWRRWSARWHA